MYKIGRWKVLELPRPDFLERCFPDGNVNDDMKCTGNKADVIQGYKSFPSGHSSFAFSSLGYVALYIAGKCHCFSSKGRGHAYKLCMVAVPLVWAALIAASRTADFHHHWQDVSVGSILGMYIGYLCYRQYYPSIYSSQSHIPYSIVEMIEIPLEHISVEEKPVDSLLKKV